MSWIVWTTSLRARQSRELPDHQRIVLAQELEPPKSTSRIITENWEPPTR